MSETKTLSEIRDSLKALNPRTEVLAVSKLQPIEKIRALYSQGQRRFGENYVQEALEKQEQLKDLPDIEWHLIGRLQKNKAKFVVGRFALIHSVDSLELAQTLNRKSSEAGLIQKVLLQLNLAEEVSKGGFSLENLESLLPELEKLKSLQVNGLMTMPPLFDNPEDARPYFRQLAQLRMKLVSRFPHLVELSMGTSSDYMVAAEEGATLVRLGTMVFGDRPKPA